MPCTRPSVPDNRFSEGLQVVLAAGTAVVLGPIVALAGAAVTASTRGTPIYSQVRVGLDGKPFTLYKLRTMTTNSGPGVTVGRDARITPVGRVLRKSKIDELPQLLNVLKRDMNLVGPRPELPLYVQTWDPCQAAAILSVRPGITGLASVRFVNESALLAAQPDPMTYYVDTLTPLKMAIEADYVRTRSVKTDLRILGLTIRAVLSKGSAQHQH